MKITTDVNYVGMRPAGSVSSRIQVPSTVNTAAQNNQLANEMTVRLQRDRAMMDALTIAQSSRALVQKAMDISARMRTIAFQAMTTGSVNVQDLGNEIASIQGTLQTYGEIVSIPVSDSGNRGVVIAEFMNQVNNMSTGAEQLASGGKVDPEFFTKINSSLSAIASESDIKINNMAAYLGSSGKNLAAVKSGYTAAVSEMIVTNPELSLTVQGNINPEVVKSLTAV
ncbi:MAG TPA: hypothetical protein PK514_00530 [Spirochaetota bacterium]|nr:hypothetical protein [Spirochaetota bacterium]